MTRVNLQFAFDASVTTLTQTIMESGFVEMINVVMPNFTNSVTATVTISDADGNIVWTKSSIAENATTRYGNGPDAAAYGRVPIDYGFTANVLLSGAAGGSGGTASVVLYCAED